MRSANATMENEDNVPNPCKLEFMVKYLIRVYGKVNPNFSRDEGFH